MDKRTEGTGRHLLEERRNRRHWTTLVVLLAILVSTGTFLVLRHNAIAATYKKRVLDCQQISGTVAHIHNDDCYDKNGLVCPLEEIAPHLHTSECYEKELVCGLEESAGHVHTEECWAEETNLVCGLDEHVHGPECYELTLICEEDEALPEYDEAGELVNPGHVHTDACYANELICEEEEHVHSESCWETTRYTVCGLEEGEGAHQHDESCYVSNLICGQEELPVHIHDANCFITVDLTPEEVEAMRDAEAGETVEGETEEVKTEEEQRQAEESTEGADAADETLGQTEPADGVPAEGDSEDGKRTTDETTEDEEAAALTNEQAAETAIDAENYPAQRFEGEAAGLLVTVNAPAGAFPKDTEMVVSPIEDENVLNAATAEVQGEVVLVQGVDISFYDADGNEIEPLLPIQVEMVPSVESAPIIPDMTEVSNEQTLVHVDNELSATVVEQEDKLTPEVRFESDSFSAYIVVYTRIEKTVLASDGNNYRITVTCDPASGVPENATLEVTEIPLDSEIYDSYRSMTEEALDKNRSLAFARFFDISILIDGAEIQPTGPVQVKIELADLPEETVNADTQVIHFGEDTEILTPIAGDGDIHFQAESFSVYGVVYTVDFHYEMNGQVFDFSIPGGAYLSFTDLVKVLGIAADDPDTDTDEAAEFVNNVENVSFSDPTLVWTGKVEADTTVGVIREQNSLTCEYSEDLTEDQINLINAAEIKAPDWVLISLKPFTSEETLTVTMKNGDTFTVQVTDAQIKTTVITSSGDTYEITVTYDDTAEIPEGAELRVVEITEENAAYLEYLEKTREAVGDEPAEAEENTVDDTEPLEVSAPETDLESDTQNMGEEEDSPAEYDEAPYARFFDIEIWADGQKVDPKSAVIVSIRLLDAPNNTDATPKVVHFGQTGPERMTLLHNKDEQNVETSDGGAEKLSFSSDAFSVYSVIYTVDFSFEVNGKEYAFSLEGGDSTSFKEILERFEILEKKDAEKFIRNIEKVEFTSPEYLWNGKLTEDAFAGELKEKNQLEIQYAPNIQNGNILAMDNHHYSAPDWILIALKPFLSEETLTVMMKNGEVFTIQVTDAQSDAVHNADGTVQTIPNPQGTTFELFNYYVSADTKTTPGRDQWPGHIHNDTDFWMFNWYNLDGTFAASWGDGWNQNNEWRNQHLLGYGNNLGINAGHVFKFTPANAGTVIDGTKGTKSVDGDSGGLNSWTEDADPRQGIVQGMLVNGYPCLTNNSNLGTDGSSLAYLFDSSPQDGKESAGAVNHLLYVDPDGYYTYDSRDFRAYIQPDGNFVVSNQPNSDDTELKGFWPFGDQVFWVGLHMNTQFSMPANGQVLNPREELKDMQFEFSGDDDTWLYIDGVLVGDGGGIHNRTEIDVNFATGKVIVTGLKDPVHTGTFYQELWLDDIFRAAHRYNDADWEEIPGTGHKRFKAGTYHTFDMFYLERGGGESNLYIHYNLVSTDDFTAHKSYEGFADGERMARDQFQFEIIGLDGQYQSVWDSGTQTATVIKLNDDGHAIMPNRGSENGAGTFGDPKKIHSNSAYTDSKGNTLGGTILTTGVLENGDIRFGSANISADEMLACDQGHPSLYRYIIREKVPDDAVNADGITWADATGEQKAAGGFVKGQIKYDNRIYYMTARVTSWSQTGADGQTFTAYGLSKTYYTDDTFTEVDSTVSFVDFRNLYSPDNGSAEFTKVDGSNRPLQGAEFTLYTDAECTKIAKDLGNVENGTAGTEQVKTTGEDGKIVFDNMAAPRTYYMKETKVPDGYEPNNTVYKVIIESSKDKTKSSKIVVVGDETETPITKIVNTKAGEINVIKEWVDQNGSPVTGVGRPVRVKIQRLHYQQGASSTPHTVSFTVQIKNRSDLVYTYTATNVVGTSVAVDWWDTNQSIDSISVRDSGGNTLEYQLSNYWDDVNHKNRKLTVNNITSDFNVTVVYPDSVNWLFNSPHAPWMKNVLIAGSGPTYDLTADTEFNNSTEETHFATLSSPGWSKTWTIGSGKDFPASDGVHAYRYYVVEVDENGNVLEPLQETGQGYKLRGYSENNAQGITDHGGVIVYNQIEIPKTIDIVVKKTDNIEDSTNYLDGAVFRLEYRQNDNVSWTNVPNTAVSQLSADSTFTVPKDGITLTGLTDGQYRLHEITAPAGYVISVAYPVVFTVSQGSIASTEGTITGVRYTAAADSDDAEFSIPNTPGIQLPQTGGEGTLLFSVFGTIFMLTATIGIMAQRRKKEQYTPRH